MNDFTAAVQYIASTLNVAMLNSNTNNRRNIPGTNHKNNGKRQGKTNNNKKLTRSYTPEEWRKLSREQRKEILEARAKNKELRAKEKDKDGNNNRLASAARNTPYEPQDDDDESYIDFHAGNVTEIIRKKNIAAAHNDDAGDHMSSR
jgi:hypothetical protein